MSALVGGGLVAGPDRPHCQGHERDGGYSELICLYYARLCF
jgi:hypothetical protein